MPHTGAGARMVRALVLAGAIGAAAAACGSEAAAPARTSAGTRGGVVDSAISTAAALRKFRTRVGPAPDTLGHAAPTQDSLVRLVLGALARRDTAALARAAITASEFAYFYYPGAREAQPPYELPPGIMWLRLSAGSDKGLRRLLRDRSGVARQLVRYGCEPAPQRGAGAARATVYARCTVTYAETAGRQRRPLQITEPLFAAVLEHGGRFKILSYANEL